MLKLQELGYTNAYALLGGLSAWQSANYPTEMAPEPPTDAPATNTNTTPTQHSLPTTAKPTITRP